MSDFRCFRQPKGLTQEDLASLLGVSRQTVIAWERGKARPSLVYAARLAHLLGVPVEAFLGGGFSRASPLLFRAEPGAPLDPGLQEVLAGASARLPQARSGTHLDPRRPLDRELLEDLAQGVRRELEAEEGPLGDMVALLEAKGLKVLVVRRELSGLFACTEEAGGAVFLDQEEPVERQYFTALHELAHLILHRAE